MDESLASNISLFFQYSALPVGQFARTLSNIASLYEEEYEQEATSHNYPLLLMRSDTSNSIWIDVWTAITNFTPELIEALKILLPSALGLSILHEFYKIRLTKAEIFAKQAEARKTAAETKKLEIETELLTLKESEARKKRVKDKATVLIESIDTPNITTCLIAGNSAAIVPRLTPSESSAPVLEHSIDHIKSWLESRAGNEQWQNDSELIGAWLEWGRGIYHLEYDYGNYIALCLKARELGFPNQSWILSQPAFAAIERRDRRALDLFDKFYR